MTYELFISSVASYYVKKNLITEQQIDVFEYGISLTIASLISFAITLTWGLVFCCFFEVLVFLSLFVPLRMFSGGYHARSFSRCILLLIVILALLSLSINTIQVTAIRPIIFLSSIFSIHVIFICAPVQHPNAPIRREDIPKYAQISKAICVTEIAFISVASFIPIAVERYQTHLVAANYSLIIGSILVCFAKATKSENEV